MAAMMEPGSGTAIGALPEGYRLGGFEIRRLLWRGPASLVYAAHDHSLDVPVALEEYMPERLAERGEEAHVQPIEAWQSELIERGLRAFVAESRALARCNDAALLKVSQIWQANGTVYRVMPPLEGQTLFERRKAMHTAPDEAWLRALALQLLDALQAYHAQVGVHGALSPGHVLIGANDRALLLGPGAAASTLANELGESPRSDFELAFAAPEMVDAHDAAARGPWSDLYSLGHLLRYCISGEEPVLREPMRALIRRVYGADGALDYSAALIDTLDAAASPLGRDRPASADEFRARLQRRSAAPGLGTPSAPAPLSPQPPPHAALPTLSVTLPAARAPISAPVPLAPVDPALAPTVPPPLTPASSHSEDTTIAPIVPPGASRKQRRRAEAEAAARAQVEKAAQAAEASEAAAAHARAAAKPPPPAPAVSEPAFDPSRFTVADSGRATRKIDPSFEPTVLLRPGVPGETPRPAPQPATPAPAAVHAPPAPMHAPHAHVPQPQPQPQPPAPIPPAAAQRDGNEPYIASIGAGTRGPGGAADDPSPTPEVDAPAIALLVSQAVEYASARAREAGHPDPAALRAALNVAPAPGAPAYAPPPPATGQPYPPTPTPTPTPTPAFGGYAFTPPPDPVPPARPAVAPGPRPAAQTVPPPRPAPAPAPAAGATSVDTSTMAPDAAPFATSGFRVQSLGLEPIPAPPPGDPFAATSTRVPHFGAEPADRVAAPARRRIRPAFWTAGLLLVIAALAVTVIYIVSGAYQPRGPAFALPSPTAPTDTAPSTTAAAPLPEPGAPSALPPGTAAAPVDGTAAAPVAAPTSPQPAPITQTAPTTAPTTAPAATGDAGAAAAEAAKAGTRPPPATAARGSTGSNAGTRAAATTRPAPARPAADADTPAPAPRTEAIREPRQACAGKTQFALYRCMQAVCSEGHWVSHPQCVRLRTQDAVD